MSTSVEPVKSRFLDLDDDMKNRVIFDLISQSTSDETINYTIDKIRKERMKLILDEGRKTRLAEQFESHYDGCSDLQVKNFNKQQIRIAMRIFGTYVEILYETDIFSIMSSVNHCGSTYGFNANNTFNEKKLQKTFISIPRKSEIYKFYKRLIVDNDTYLLDSFCKLYIKE